MNRLTEQGAYYLNQKYSLTAKAGESINILPPHSQYRCTCDRRGGKVWSFERHELGCMKLLIRFRLKGYRQVFELTEDELFSLRPRVIILEGDQAGVGLR